MKDSVRRLYEADVALAKELWLIRAALSAYTIIGLNASRIETCMPVFGLLQKQSLDAVALGLARVFEREKPQYKLYSIRGVFALARDVNLERLSAKRDFVAKYGGRVSDDWIADIEQVLTERRAWVRERLKAIHRVRNTYLAHAQLDRPEATLPSIAVFEELLSFALDFRAFISDGFLSTHPHPIMADRSVASSMVALLRRLGVQNPREDFDSQ